MRQSICIAILAAATLGSTAFATTSIEVKFEGTGPTGFAPLFVAFHDGSYDTFDSGSAASSNLETLAEVGNPSGLVGDATAPAVGADAGAVGSGGVGPLSTRSAVIVVSDSNTMFNYASMVLPTNDWFIGNGMASDVSNLINATVGTSKVIEVGTVWDAGTEDEDFDFSAGNPLFAGLPATPDTPGGGDQGGVISAIDRSGGNPFSVFGAIPGFDIPAAVVPLDFSGSDSVARITLTVVPEPASLMALGLGALGLFARRPRRRV